MEIEEIKETIGFNLKEKNHYFQINFNDEYEIYDQESDIDLLDKINLNTVFKTTDEEFSVALKLLIELRNTWLVGYGSRIN